MTNTENESGEGDPPKDSYKKYVNRNVDGRLLSDDEVWLYETMGRRLESAIVELVLDKQARIAGKKRPLNKHSQREVKAFTRTLRRLDQGTLLELVKTNIQQRFPPQDAPKR